MIGTFMQNLTTEPAAAIESRNGHFDSTTIRTVTRFGTPGAMSFADLRAEAMEIVDATAMAATQETNVETARLTPYPVTESLMRATSRAEAAMIADEHFRIREAVADEVNSTLSDSSLQFFIGGEFADVTMLPKHAVNGLMDSVERNLRDSQSQFASFFCNADLSGKGGSDLHAIAEAVKSLGANGGSRVAISFGSRNGTGFFPCANNNHGYGGIVTGLGDPGKLYRRVTMKANLDSKAEAIADAQCEMLLVADKLGRKIAASIGTAWFGIDPSAASKNLPSEPQQHSFGAVIKAFSGVPLGSPGTKAGFAALLAALRHGEQMAGVPLTGFDGAFIPVAEDDEMAAAVAAGTMSYHCLLDLQHCCASGLDMVVVPPTTSIATIARIFGDVAITQKIKGRMLAARIIVPDMATPCDKYGYYNLGGLLGSAPPLLGLEAS